MKNIIIAIDGPAGTGKGTIASHVASSLGYFYLDTGIYYRAIAYLVLKNNIDIQDNEQIVDIARKMSIEIHQPHSYVNGEKLTSELRTNEIDSIVSQISGIIPVRMLVNDRIRNYAYDKDIVIDGRDITTTVFKEATYKFYIDAAVDTRARRRYNQNCEMGITSDYNEILNNLIMRDNYDRNKEYGALAIADDAHIIDTTNLTVDEAINSVIKIIRSEIK